MKTSYGMLMVAALASGLGCGAMPSPEAPNDLAEVHLALSSIPTGVQCLLLTVTVNGQVVIPPPVTVVAGAASTSVNLGQLPSGNAIFNGAAYAIACSGVMPSVAAAWQADTASATLSEGTVTVVQMTFRRNNPVSVNANFVDNVAEITTGRDGTYARMTDGTVKGWGSYTTNYSPTPTVIPGLTDVAQVAAGSSFACARKNADGSVWCWGNNGAGQLGPAGPAGGTLNPVKVPLSSPASNIVAGDSHVCANTNGTLIYCWGANTNGQLGIGTLTNSATPVLAQSSGRVFAGGNTTCSIDGNQDTLSCWGANNVGQVGNGLTSAAQSTPVSLALRGVASMALGPNHSCAVRVDGSLSCWGSATRGQLGDGTTTARLTPTAINSVADALQVQVGVFHTCVRRQNGAVMCWGAGQFLGDGVGDDRLAPLASPVIVGATAIRIGGGFHTCAELSNHTVSCWGANAYGQSGDGTSIFANLPVQVKLQ